MKAYRAVELANKRAEIGKKKNEKALLKLAKKEVRAAARVGRTTITFTNEVYVSGFGFMPADVTFMKKYFEEQGFKVQIWTIQNSERIQISWHTSIKPAV